MPQIFHSAAPPLSQSDGMSGTRAVVVRASEQRCSSAQWKAAACLALGLIAFLGLCLSLPERSPIDAPPVALSNATRRPDGSDVEQPDGIVDTRLAAALAQLRAREAALNSSESELADALDAARMEDVLVAPLPNASKVLTLIAHGSCANQAKHQAFWGQLARAQPQLFVLNGDIVYGDCGDDDDDAGCAELAGAWRQLFAHSNFGSVRANLPMLGALDDHDYGQNDCGADNPYKHFAKAHFLRRWASPPTDPRWTRPGVYMSTVHGPPGRRTQLILTDVRWDRSRLIPTDCLYCAGKERYVAYNASAPDAREGGPRMMGEEQWAWLEEQLRQPADVRLLFSTLQVLADGHGWEAWRLIPAERRRLLELIGTTGASGVVLLSGDRHVGGLYKAARGEWGAPYDLYEVTSSSLTHSYRGHQPNPTDEAGPNRLGALVHENHFGTVRIDWAARQLTLRLLAADDCGVSHQGWGQQCDEPGSGVAGETLLDLTLNLDELRA